MSKRRTHCPEFKAKVAMEAIQGIQSAARSALIFHVFLQFLGIDIMGGRPESPQVATSGHRHGLLLKASAIQVVTQVLMA